MSVGMCICFCVRTTASGKSRPRIRLGIIVAADAGTGIPRIQWARIFPRAAACDSAVPSTARHWGHRKE